MDNRNYRELITYIGNNSVLCLADINGDTVEFCIDNFYFTEDGAEFIIYTLVEPRKEYKDVCERMSNELGINIICRKRRREGGE